ncbi:MAG TPA: hypothetical protein VNW96_15300 [Mycobacterium sp.]|nr:hypothetical protein [Mycobacterium sp.]
MDLSHSQGVDGELTTMATPQEIVDARPAVFDALDFEAPYLVEKLVKDRVVDSAEQGSALFTEVKRYLVLNQVDRTKAWKMYSLRVDEVWHQFVLFTVEYSAFCDKYFGHYAHHAPSNAPDPGFEDRAPEATFAEFGDRYREIFGVELPDVWDDSTSVTPHRRILNDRARQLELGSTDDMIDLIGRNGRVLFSVSEIARDALRFIVDTGAFYVRELPGGLTDDEKVALVATLVDMKLLRVG